MLKWRIIEGVIIFLVISLITAAWSGTVKVWNLEDAVSDIQTKLTSIESKLNKISCRLVPGSLDCDP